MTLQLLEYGDQPSQFLGLGDSLRTGTRALRPDIDNVGTLLLQLHGATQRRLRLGILAAIAERVRRHVQNSHHQRSFAKGQRTAAELPLHSFSNHLFPVTRLLLVSETDNRVQIRGPIRGVVAEEDAHTD